MSGMEMVNGRLEVAWACPLDTYKVFMATDMPPELEHDPYGQAQWQTQLDEDFERFISEHEARYHGI